MTHANSPVLLTTGNGTAAVVLPVAGDLIRIVWVGAASSALDSADLALVATDIAEAVGAAGPAVSSHGTSGRSIALLPAVADAWTGRPGLQGHRLAERDASPGAVAAGRRWSARFVTTTVDVSPAGTSAGESTHRGTAVRVDAVDHLAELALTTRFEAVAGGLLRIRHELTNSGAEPYVVDALDVTIPLPDHVGEVLDFTGRWGRERSPQRHRITDGVWLRESRGGRPGHGSATELIAGTPGFGFRSGDVWAVHLAWSGNSRHWLERQPSGQVTFGAGELLLPGEIVLSHGQTYRTPWVYLAASAAGTDGLAEQFHGYLRSLPAHPRLPRPVVSNVWEAVYFDHDLDRLRHLADLAASIGIERLVLDDGWFGGRRDDTAGLGDWTVSPDAWPDGLAPFVDHVRGLGLDFGLWFEPEMVNPDSDLYRAHPDWVLAASGREPYASRHQLVLDLGRAEVRDHLFDSIDAVLSAYPIGFVKWDHNRALPEAAARDRDDAPGAHAQTLGFYDLLDRLRAAHPDVEWESCASGGGRIDLEVLQRVQRVWTSDMTDALARQDIQRWTGQLVAPEYLGAHVSAPVNHQTGRVLDLDFRAATAFFGDLGVEWDIASASEYERAQLAAWIALYKQHRELLHSGVVVRADTGNTGDALRVHGVVADDGSAAVVGYFQLDETVADPPSLRVPGLLAGRRYRATQLVPAPVLTGDAPASAPAWRGNGMLLSGHVLATVGLPPPPRQPLTALLVHLAAE